MVLGKVRVYLNNIVFFRFLSVPFAFDSPSPDDQVLAARRRGTGTAKKPPASPNGKPAPFQAAELKPVPKPYDPIRNRRQSAPAVGLQDSATEGKKEKAIVEQSVRRLSLDDQVSDRGQGEPSSSGRGEGSGATVPPGKRKWQSLPLSTYRPDEELLAEIRSRGGEKDVLNLIIVGHVDAGKSTLMGRVLHALGQVRGGNLIVEHSRDVFGCRSFCGFRVWLARSVGIRAFSNVAPVASNSTSYF